MDNNLSLQQVNSILLNISYYPQVNWSPKAQNQTMEDLQVTMKMMNVCLYKHKNPYKKELQIKKAHIVNLTIDCKPQNKQRKLYKQIREIKLHSKNAII